MEVEDVIVVGSGISGLSAAKKLHDSGKKVLCIEKARGVGGRTSVRRIDDGDWADMGAPFFTARHESFQKVIEELKKSDQLRSWQGPMVYIKGQEHHEATPSSRYVMNQGLNQVAKYLAKDLTIKTQTKVTGLKFTNGIWQVSTDSQGKLHTNQLVLAIPIDQAVALLEDSGIHGGFHTKPVSMLPCWATMIVFKSKLKLPYTGYFIRDNPLAFMADNYGKVGDEAKITSSFTLQASHDWSRMNLERDADWVVKQMLDQFAGFVDQDLPEISYIKAHRWRYANCGSEHEPSQFHFPDQNLTLCGDWVLGGRVEGAFLSGSEAADLVMGKS